MGLFSGGSGGPSTKELYKKSNLLSAAGIETVEAGQARALAAEKARMNLFSSLGQEGTYGTPGTPGAPAVSVPGATNYYDPNDTFGEAGSKLADAQFRGGGRTPGFMAWESRAGILDPEKYAAEVKKTSLYRQASQRVAEAEQLVNQEGPLWNKLQNATYGVLLQGTAMAKREDARAALSARKRGAGGASQPERERAVQAQANARHNYELTQNLFRANVEMFDLVRKNQVNALNYAGSVFESLPELRSGFQNTMAEFAKLQAGTAIPMAQEALQSGYMAADMQAKPTALQRVLGGVIGALSGAAQGGGLTGAVLGGVLGATPELNMAAGLQGPTGGAFGQTVGPALAGAGRSAMDWMSGERTIGAQEERGLISSGWGS